MTLAKRKETYQAIEDFRKRPLIVMATSTRHGVKAKLTVEIVRELVDQIDAIEGGKAVDVLLHSTGGDALAAWKLMSILRERFDTVGVLVPFMAFSAATIFALGADEIIMHPHASLGPIDPQITVTNNGQRREFAYEDAGAFLRFLHEEVGASNQQQRTALVEKLFAAVDPLHIGSAKRASELASHIGERLLKFHMTDKDKSKAKQIATNLNKSFFAHGDEISRTRARELGLKVAERDVQLESLIWNAFSEIESYMELRKPFIPEEQCFADTAGAAALSPAAILNLPANAPAQIAQEILQLITRDLLLSNPIPAAVVPYRQIGAIVESTRLASCYAISGDLLPSRSANNAIVINRNDKKLGWEHVNS